jgi:hypothetical protein
MSQATRGVEPVSPSGEAIQFEITPDAGLPPPLDEIAARSRNRSVGTTRAARKPKGMRSRSRASQSTRREVPAGEVVVGTFVGLSELLEPLVEYPLISSERARPARSTIPLDPSQIGREVVLAFECGDSRNPIILGVLARPCDLRSEPKDPGAALAQSIVEVQRDGEQLLLTAEKEIVLCCGEASITLTRAGKILIRGTYLLSRSSGVNRIKGGSVQIN